MATNPHRQAALPARRLLDLHAVADELGCSFYTVDRLLRNGRLSFVRMPSGRRRVRREDLDAAIQQWMVAGR
jgi:excisionase family DNA binding protein